MNIKLIRLVLVFLLCSCNNKLDKTMPVTENITASVYAAGIVKTRNQYQVFSTVSGIVDKIFITENDLVKKGNPLMLLSDNSSRFNRENADLAAKYADLQENKEKLTDLKNNIALAASKYSNDSLTNKRQENLWEQGIGTKLELEQKELVSQASKISLESAKIKYIDLLKQLELNAKQSINNLAISRSKEGDFTIKSEINGKVYFIFPKRGEIVSPQTVLAIIGDSSDFYMELEVDEYDIVKIREGQKALISMDSYKQEVFEAGITKINPLMNERTKTFTIEAKFLKRPPVLYPNLTVEANIIILTKDKALTIPRNYLLNDSFVLIHKTERKGVKTGIKDYQKVEILEGLTETDVIYKPKE
jgi:HlyD family secretion protein